MSERTKGTPSFGFREEWNVREFVTVQKYWWDLCHVKSAITSNDLAIIQTMWTHSNEHAGSWCFLSVRGISRLVLKSERAVARSLSTLEGKGLVEVDRRDGRRVRRRPVIGRVDDFSRTMTRASGSLYSSFHSSKNNTKIPLPETSEDLAKGIDMPLFDIQTKQKQTKETSEDATRLSKQLYDALGTCVGLSPKRGAWKRWAVDFDRLMSIDGIEVSRISKVVNWLCQPTQIKKTKARSGRMFRTMFDSLESFAMDYSESPQRDLTKQELLLLKSIQIRLPETTSEDIRESILIVSETLVSMSKRCRQDWNRRALASFVTLESILFAMSSRLQNWSKWNGKLSTSAKRISTSPELLEWCEHRDINIQTLLEPPQ